MWYQTKASEILGIQYPILQGPFGGNLSSVELVVAVSEAGGLGGYGAYTLGAEEIFQLNRQIRAKTNKPYNLNLWVSDHDAPATDGQFQRLEELFLPYFKELGIEMPQRIEPFKTRFENQIEVILDLKPPVFSFVFGTFPLEEIQR